MCQVQGPMPKNPVPAPMAVEQPLPFYLDHNATTPLCDEAFDAMCSVRHAWGNPSSMHPYGLEGKFHLDAARATFQQSLGASSPECVVFTGSGTEANNLALVGGLASIRKCDPSRNVIVSTTYEHPAVEEVLQMFEKGGYVSAEEEEEGEEQEGEGEKEKKKKKKSSKELVEIKVVRVKIDPSTGLVDVNDFTKVIQQSLENLAIVSVMHANNELGSVNPISELVKIVRKLEDENNSKIKSETKSKKIPCLFHTDAAQSIGKVEVNISKLGVDLLSVCAHKFYGPKGVGALVLRTTESPCTPGPVLRGAKHERGIRPSTENTMMVTAAAAALKSVVDNLEKNSAHARACRDLLYSELKRRLEENGDFEIQENGSVAKALPNTLNVAFYNKKNKIYISAARLIISLGRKIAMSSGSACHASQPGVVIPVSSPLKAVGADLERAIGTLRLSTGKLSRLQDMPRVAQILAHAMKMQMPQE